MAILIIVLILAIVMAEVLIGFVCHDANTNWTNTDGTLVQGDCHNNMRMPVYAALSVAVLIFVPLQVLFIRIFKAHADELKNEAGYSELPTDEPQTA